MQHCIITYETIKIKVCVFVNVADPSELTGMTNLMSYYGLEHSYSKFSSKKVKEELSAFLPTLPGNIDMSGNQDNRFVVILFCVFL